MRRNPTRDKHLPKPIVLLTSQKGNSFSPNSENVGGRYIIDRNFRKHQESMTRIKKQVDNSLPWSYQQRSSLYSVGAYHNTSTFQQQRQGNNTRSKKSPRKRIKSKKKIKENLDFVVLRSDPTLLLDPEEKQIYDSFVNMLCEFCRRGSEKNTASYLSDITQQIGKSAASEAIERYLLQDYGLKYPDYGNTDLTDASHPVREEEKECDVAYNDKNTDEVEDKGNDEEKDDERPSAAEELTEEDEKIMRELLEEEEEEDSFGSFDGF